MSLLELGSRKFTIPVGEVTLGSDAGCAIALTGPGVLARHALLQGQPDGQVIIRKAAAAAEIGTTGGRLVSLTDGREYVIAAASLVFGREAGCDVVVSGKDVSRRHAEIVRTPKGYLVVDSSTNGTFVNEEQVQGQRILARADVIRIGEEQFRFYADVAPATAEPPPPPGPAARPPQAAPPSPPAPRAAGVPSPDRLKHTVHGMEAVAPPKGSGGGPFASFLVRTGGLMGQRLVVRTPVVNIGRADYNDLVLPDPSVSTSHAKLQRREGVWVLVDLDSTNGTFVDGEQVKGDAPLAPGALVRFGEVQLVFEPTDDALGVAKGGGTQLLKTPHSMTPGPPGAPAGPAAPSGSPVIPARPPSPPGARPAPAPGSPGVKPAPAAPRPQPPGRPGGKPAPKRPVNQQPPPPKKCKGCGASSAVFLLAVAGLVALLHRLLA